jgi:serine/threonine-protein kinase HipA
MLKVSIGGRPVGALDRAKGKTFAFSYASETPPGDAVSLTMPPRVASYLSGIGQLHPIFDMNLPEGFLRQWLSKVVPDFDDMVLLKLTGASQIGRLQYDAGEPVPDGMKVSDILAYDGAEDLFRHLLDMYGTASGVSGVQPKVLIRDVGSHKMSRDHKVTVLGSTHIVKTWDAMYPHLARNEHFCLSAARHAGLATPDWEVSSNGKFLVIERFDLLTDSYLGVEDLCVLAGMTTVQKYQGSYEQLAKSLRTFISQGNELSCMQDFFKMIALSCVVRNGDAHRKNFCLLYESAESRTGRLAPTFDIVTTCAYLPMDVMALTMAGSKRWPDRQKLIRFAGVCGLTSERAGRGLNEVEAGVVTARDELITGVRENPEFAETGHLMLKAWDEGLLALIK